jgi:uncharacterized damage-inducible protein DinB
MRQSVRPQKLADFIRKSNSSWAAASDATAKGEYRMSTLEQHFRSMARNNLWSNHRLHQACAHLSPGEYTRERGAFFGSIHGTLNHILLIDRWYLGRLTGELFQPLAPRGTELHTDLKCLAVAQLASDRELIGFCDLLDPSELTRAVHWTTVEGRQCSDPVHVVLTHLFLHQIHHRGQVHQMLCATDVPAPQLDEFFLSSDAPLRQAEVDQLGLGVPTCDEGRNSTSGCS